MQDGGIPRRLKLQFSHIKDMIREQNRMVLTDVEPTESEREDMLMLLSDIKASIESEKRRFPILIEEYNNIKFNLTELGYNVSEFTLLESRERTNNQDIQHKAKKQVHFEDQNNSELTGETQFPYSDDLITPTTSSEPTDDTQSSTQIYDQNNLIFEDQDRRLLQISDSIGRQRSMGNDINSELDIHNNLLEDVEAQVDRSQTRLDGLTYGVKRFNRKARECGVCSIIMALVLILLLVLLI